MNVLTQILPAALLAPLALHASHLSLEPSGAELQLAWNSEQGLVYSIETSSNLTLWIDSGFSEAGDGSRQQTPAAEGSQMFFRLGIRYQNDEEGAVQDMLTPVYYNATNGAPFREALNEFIYFAQKEPFHHPLQNGTNAIPSFTVPLGGRFGANKKNQSGTVVQYHPAVDLHVGSGETNVNLYAAYSGVVSTARDLTKYRQAVYLTKTVTNETGVVLGKLVTLYAHVDLDLDEASGLFMDGQTVQAGDLISEHLYSETVGGPHVHFEIRYYRPGETGNEEFYGYHIGDYTEPSAGIWEYGYWKPDIGYGFGDPENHGLKLAAD